MVASGSRTGSDEQEVGKSGVWAKSRAAHAAPADDDRAGPEPPASSFDETPAGAALPSHVLLVEDEDSVRFAVARYLGKRGLRVTAVASCADAWQAFCADAPDVVVLDYALPDGEALSLFKRLKQLDPGLPCILVTGHGTVEIAVEAMRSGANDVLTKPFDLSLLDASVQKLARRRGAPAALGPSGSPLSGRSPVMRALFEAVEKAALASCPVLLLGETGTGKSTIARHLHARSARAAGPFIDINAGSLSAGFVESELFGHVRGAFTGAHETKRGLFEMAEGGTLFLDEVGDVDPGVQVKLLKALEERRYRRMGDSRERTADVRLIAATHQNVPELLRDGRFRADLYYRLSTITLTVPPLRDRGEDVLELANGMLVDLAARLGRAVPTLTPQAEEQLLSYRWPGNVRELRNVLERSVLMQQGPMIDASDVRVDEQVSAVRMVEAQGDGASSLRDAERRCIERALAEAGGHVETAAKALKMPRSTLYARLREYGLTTKRRR